MSTMGERIRDAREKKGLYQSQLAELIGVKSAGVISNWEKDLNKPDADKIIRLCDSLKVSLSYLLDYTGGQDFVLHPHEQETIKKYRALDSHGKESVDWTLNHEYTRCTSQPEEIEEESIIYNIRSMQLSDQPASAGRGTYLGPESFHTIMVQKNDLTDRALFAVPVSGNSMEPTYYDGDILLVEKTEELQEGEIGIFTLDGEGYVKKLGDKELISLNPDYAPIPMNESILLNGKVIGILEDEWIVER